MKTLTPHDNGREVSVTVGQVLVVELPSNRTTGYGWNDRSEGVAVVERVSEPAYMQDSSPVGLVGVGGTEIWRFRATKVGRQTLRLDYARSWEKDVAPVQTVSFNVVVADK
jgi:predicted secreted protein